uniref:Claudin n=1 Tax=Esox lucius TaxID=8010 RepID=A0AAY5JXY4_ESOLU
MSHRTVMMYTQIGCFVSCLFGWILVSSTLAIEYWTWSEVSNVVLTTSNYFSNLWKDCVSDTTGVSDCKDYPSMMALPGRQPVRLGSVHLFRYLGFFAGVLTLIGMKCTKIGGSELANARVTIPVFLLGFSGMIVYSCSCFYWLGSSLLLITGGFVLSFFSGKRSGICDLTYSFQFTESLERPYSIALAGSRQTYMRAKLSRGTPVPPMIQASRKDREAETRTSRTYNRDATAVAGYNFSFLSILIY